MSPSYWRSQVLDSNKTKKLTAQGQEQALTMLDTWTRARGRIPSNPHTRKACRPGPTGQERERESAVYKRSGNYSEEFDWWASAALINRFEAPSTSKVGLNPERTRTTHCTGARTSYLGRKTTQ